MGRKEGGEGTAGPARSNVEETEKTIFYIQKEKSMLPDFRRFSQNLVLRSQAEYSFGRNFRLPFRTDTAHPDLSVRSILSLFR